MHICGKGLSGKSMDREWNDSQPIYRQVRDRVVAMIRDGVLKEGDPLPTTRDRHRREDGVQHFAFGAMLRNRMGGGTAAVAAPRTLPMDPMTQLTPGQLLD